MLLFHASLGGGISGIETLLSIINKVNLIHKKKKNSKKNRFSCN